MSAWELKLISQIHLQHYIMFQYFHPYTSPSHFVVFCNLNLNIQMCGLTFETSKKELATTVFLYEYR
jgi:hypothetical protein